jgi:hypothetical protein
MTVLAKTSSLPDQIQTARWSSKFLFVFKTTSRPIKILFSLDETATGVK